MKGFQIGMVEDLIGSVIGGDQKGKVDVFGKLAKVIGGKSGQSSKALRKKDQWNQIAASRSSFKRNQIGSRDQGLRRASQASLRRSVLESERDAILSMNQDQLVEYNPRLKEYTPATRVAYAKFKAKTLPKQEGVKGKAAKFNAAATTTASVEKDAGAPEAASCKS